MTELKSVPCPSRRGVNPRGYVSPQEKSPLVGSAGSNGTGVNAPDFPGARKKKLYSP